MTIEKDFFRQVLGQFATGVTIVTTEFNQVRAGLTVNSFCSVSLEPPLILVCVDLNSQTLPVLRQSGTFAVNILTTEQEALSRCFAIPSDERYLNFCHASSHPVATGAPILDDVLAFIDARIVAEYPGGDHVIFLGKVEALGTQNHMLYADGRAEEAPDLEHAEKMEVEPLAYFRGNYRRLALNYERPSISNSLSEPEPTASHVE